MTKDKLIQLVADAGASATAYIKTEDIVLLAEARQICEKNGCGKYGKCYMCPPFAGEIEKLTEELLSYPGGVLYQSVGALEDSFDFDGMMEAAKSHALLSRRIEQELHNIENANSPAAGEAVKSPEPAGTVRSPKPAGTGHVPLRHLHLTNGGCDLCEKCGALDGTPCRHPDLALPSVESYGMDVYRTSRAAGLKYNNGPGTVTYFGLVLFE